MSEVVDIVEEEIEKIEKPGHNPETKEKPPALVDKMIELKLGITQRRWIAENFKDCLVNFHPNGEPYFKRLGPHVQAVMREGVQFICLYKPLRGRLFEKKSEEGCDDRINEFITIKIEIFQPVTNDKIVLERTFTKATLDTK